MLCAEDYMLCARPSPGCMQEWILEAPKRMESLMEFCIPHRLGPLCI